MLVGIAILGIATFAFAWSPNSLSGTVRDTKVDLNQGVVFLCFSRNRPCDLISVPIKLFNDEMIQAFLKPTTNDMLAGVLTLGQPLIGQRITAKGKVEKIDDGYRVIQITDWKQVTFHDR